MTKISKTNRESILKDLKSGDETFVLKAIEQIKKDGDATYIVELLKVLDHTTDPSIESAIAQLLFDLKDKNAIEELVNHLNDPTLSNIRIIMLSACWQSGMDLSHRLPDLITVATTGSYMECLEVLTVVENWDAVEDQEMLENEIIRLQAYLSESDTPENDEMIFSIVEELQKFRVQ